LITTRASDLLGLSNQRNRLIIVFLGHVRCRDFITVPETITILAGGIRAKRLVACDGADSHTQIDKVLECPYLVSGLSGGGAHLGKGTTISIEARAGAVAGLPRNAKIASKRSLAALFPELRGEDGEAWEVLETAVRDGRRFCEIAGAPAPAKPKKVRRPAPRPTRSRLFKTVQLWDHQTGRFFSLTPGQKMHTVREGKLGQSLRVSVESFPTQQATFSDADRRIASALAQGFQNKPPS
jgi:hypothetical protein